LMYCPITTAMGLLGMILAIRNVRVTAPHITKSSRSILRTRYLQKTNVLSIGRGV
jgi:hypothetical protein